MSDKQPAKAAWTTPAVVEYGDVQSATRTVGNKANADGGKNAGQSKSAA
jgi:hypothetical protein